MCAGNDVELMRNGNEDSRTSMPHADKISSVSTFERQRFHSTERLSRPTIFHDHSTPRVLRVHSPRTPIAVKAHEGSALSRRERLCGLGDHLSAGDRAPSYHSSPFLVVHTQRTLFSLCDTLPGSSDNLPVRCDRRCQPAPTRHDGVPALELCGVHWISADVSQKLA
jgi:hypothetical protein